jgi:nickel transport protein
MVERGLVGPGLSAALLAAVLIVALPFPAQAHRLNVFASADGAVIRGSVYFQGMIPARKAPVTVLDADGALLAEMVADDAGRFAFEATRRVDHRIVADLSDGHRATFVVAAAQLPPSLPAPFEPAPGADRSANTAGEQATQQAIPPEAEIEAIVDAAVARHVGPLRQQIAAYEDKIRWNDVLGGIGYIVGMTGLAFYFLARRRAVGQGDRQGDRQGGAPNRRDN